MHNFNNMLYQCFIVLNALLSVRAFSLGSSCRSNVECRVTHAHCSRGVCACQPYYAQVDNSTCLESTLLGSECIVSEQCTLKVAYSACLDGLCRCSDGHLQFRKHTCLSPAPPGHVCYSNEHCRLWEKESHCEFVIPNLFGRCACNTNFKQNGEKCLPQKGTAFPTEAVILEHGASKTDIIMASPSTVELSNKSSKSPSSPSAESLFGNPNISDSDDIKPSNLPMFTSNNEVLSTQEDSPLMQAVMKVPTAEPSKRHPVSIRKDEESNELIGVDEMTANLHANDQPIYRVVTQPSVDKKPNKKGGVKDPNTSKTNKSQKKSSLKEKNRIRADIVSTPDPGPASLGLFCLSDSQCQLVDPNTRCLNKRCDCTYRTNSTSACSARNRGCLPGTFQCRSTGACISWYFVCDGRKDCPDGSDERCQGTGKDNTGERCPMHSFRCGGPGSACVSRGARCDGIPQCAGGEDERNCRATKRRGCPRHTFRCGSGECLPEYEFCNAIISCKDGSDEPSHLCNEQSRWRAADFCPLRCGNGRCRSTAVACSGRDGCGDNSDEIACSVCKCPAQPS
ncbi:serine protease nudel-like isoform X1 [Danaus plexippus]|uniref:serine protease nudel-like isoform X1 n=1 Tax=Danaus plexippus TaxID=13037 RepID=UPI000239DE95|nr:serine protease nudel-like isoform X1 [Danaus plexippus]